MRCLLGSSHVAGMSIHVCGCMVADLLILNGSMVSEQIPCSGRHLVVDRDVEALLLPRVFLCRNE